MNIRKNFNHRSCSLINYTLLNADEKKLVLKWRNHPGVRAWMYSDHLISAKEHYKYLKALRKDNRNFCWLVKSRQGYLGIISLNKFDGKNRNAYLGIYANPCDKVPGAGSKLMECLKFLAFKKARLHSLKLEVISINERALGFYLKHGFRKEGLLKEFVLKRGKYIDVAVLGISASRGAE